MKYPIVHVSFLDHSMTTGEDIKPVSCELVGYLVKQDKQTITIATWVSEGIINSSDTELFVLVKHKGMKVSRLK